MANGSGCLILVMKGWAMKIINILVLILHLSINRLNAFQGRLIYERLEGYNIDVYLPEGYNENANCKSIYFNDGQFVFGSKGLNIKSSIDSLTKEKIIPPIVVVAVHSDNQRTDKYVPYDDKSLFHNSSPENNLAQE